MIEGTREPKARAMDRERAPRSFVAITLIVGAAYASLGLLALWLGQMIGLASPIWPAAGVAFAAAVVWRWRALPGVALGSIAVNSVWLWNVGESANIVVPTALAIGLGATLQAALGALLVRRFVGTKLYLDMPRPIMLTLLLAGPVACLVGPTIGVGTQLATGVLGTSGIVVGWLTWWVGDAIGVIVFAPIVLMLIPSQNRFWDGRRWAVAIPSLLIMGALMTVILQNAAFERERINTAVQQLGDDATADLISNLDRHQESLEGLRGLVDASDEVTAREFATYTDDILLRSPNLQALSWNPLISEADLAAFEAYQRAQPGLKDYTVTERDEDGNLRPVTPRPEYVAVAYIEPLADNRSALGFDIYSNPARAVAIETARDSGEAIGTAPIDLVQESSSQKGMLVLLPVYEGGSVPEDAILRRESLRGFAVGVYRLGDLLAETYADPRWDDVALTLIDTTDQADPVTIADMPSRNAADVDVVSSSPVATTRPIDVFGRSWELTVQPTNRAFGGSSTTLTVTLLLSSVAVAYLLEVLLLLLSGMAARSRREAEANSYEASHDPLTGLLNRRAFVRQFEKVLDERSVAVHDALLFCDLDGFKHVNDTGGHAAGDAMLAAVALELKGQVRHDDLVARMGGDEFALLLIDCSLVDARPLAEAIVRAVESVRLPAPHGDLSIGVSIGLTMVDSSTEQSLDEHLRHVDDACYAAKKSGGDRVIVYDDIAAEAPA